jgi:hypothetical protein
VALKRHSLLQEDTRTERPCREELIRVFTASTIPFVGFGFLDNFIMVRLLRLRSAHRLTQRSCPCCTLARRSPCTWQPRVDSSAQHIPMEPYIWPM